MLQPKSNERLVSEIVRKVRNKYTRTGLNQADQLDTLWNDLGRTPDWVIGCFEEGIKEALAQKDAEVAEAREEMVGHGYRMAVRHLKEAYKHNGATTVPEAIDWLEDNARLFPTPKN